jgi:hypothetical protein
MKQAFNKSYFEIRDEYNLMVQDIAELIKTQNELKKSQDYKHNSQDVEVDTIMNKARYEETLQNQEMELNTRVRNHVITMIALCDQSLIALPGAHEAFLLKTTKIIEDFVRKALNSEIILTERSKLFNTPVIEPIAHWLYNKRDAVHGLRNPKVPEKAQFLATNIALGIINLVANICHNIAKYCRKIKGNQTLCDTFERAIEKASKELKIELNEPNQRRQQTNLVEMEMDITTNHRDRKRKEHTNTTHHYSTKRHKSIVI